MRGKMILSLICALCLCCLLAPPARAEAVTLDGIVYELKDGAAVFTRFVEGTESVTIHATVSGYAASFFSEADAMDTSCVKELVVGEDVLDLSNCDHGYWNVFTLCSAAEKVVLPRHLMVLDVYALQNCAGVKAFEADPDNAHFASVDGVLFSKDKKTLLAFPQNREGVYAVPAGTTALGEAAFSDKGKLTGLTLPEGFLSLSGGGIRNATSLKSLSLPASLSAVDVSALPYAGALTAVEVASGNTRYRSVDGVLFDRSGETLLYFPPGRGGSYAIPQGVKAVGDSAFENCTLLTEVAIPQGVEKLGHNAFSGAEGLAQLSLPASLVSIGNSALPYSQNLKRIEVAPDNKVYQSIDGVLYTKGGKKLLTCPAGRAGAYAVVPGTVSIQDDAFGWNGALTSLTLPEGIVALTDPLLTGLNGLEELSLPASLKELNMESLPKCGALRRITVAKGNPRYRSEDGVLFAGNELICFPPAWGLSYDVPSGTTSLAGDAFYSNETLQTITIPRSVTQIGAGTFSDCTALARVSLPITLKRIGQYAFSNCISLTDIALPPGLEALEDRVFYNCASLREIVIPQNMASIGDAVFAHPNQDLVLYAAQGSAGYWHAWEYGLLWAQPGGTPGKAAPVQRQTASAVVNSPDAKARVELKAKPSESAKVLGKYGNGTTVQVLEKENGWAHVKLYQTEGYMPLDSLLFTDRFNTLCRITWAKGRNANAALKLYRDASEDAPSQTLKEDALLRVLDTQGVWYLVQAGEGTGYVPVQDVQVAFSVYPASAPDVSDYAVVANPNAGDRLNLREAPTAKSKSLGRYFNGIQVEVLDSYDQQTPGWYKVRVDGQEGYMMAEYLIFVYPGGKSALLSQG